MAYLRSIAQMLHAFFTLQSAASHLQTVHTHASSRNANVITTMQAMSKCHVRIVFCNQTPQASTIILMAHPRSIAQKPNIFFLLQHAASNLHPDHTHAGSRNANVTTTMQAMSKCHVRIVICNQTPKASTSIFMAHPRSIAQMLHAFFTLQRAASHLQPDHTHASSRNANVTTTMQACQNGMSES